MIEVGDTVYSYIFPENCNAGRVISKESETAFIVEWINRDTGKLYKRTILDLDMHKKIEKWNLEV